MTFPRLKRFITVSTWISFIGGLVVIAGVVVGILTRSAIAAGGLLVLGALMLAGGFQGRWRGKQLLVQVEQDAANGPLDPIDIYGLIDIRRDLKVGLLYGVVLAAVTVIVVLLLTHR